MGANAAERTIPFTCQTQYTGNDGIALKWFIPTNTKLAKQALNALLDARAHGLDPATYDANGLDKRANRLWQDQAQPNRHFPRLDNSVAAQLNDDLTQAVICYLQQVHSGQLEPEMVHARTMLRPKHWQATNALKKAWVNGTFGDLLEQAAPQSVQYRRLQRSLATYHEKLTQREPTLDQLRQIKQTISRRTDPAALRILHDRLAFLGDYRAPAGKLTKAVAKSTTNRDVRKTRRAIKKFQRRHGIKATGRLNPRTTAALNVTLRQRIAQIEIAMERTRWLPRENVQRRVTVNIPEFTARITSNDRLLKTSRVVVGKSSGYQTPFFAGRLSRIEINPSWYVPHSIAKYKLVPKLRRDPDYFANQGMMIVERDGTEHTVLEPRLLKLVSRNKARIVQMPGDKNALGRYKFVLPNRRAIFMHDTNQPNLFKRDIRAYSSGCVRVESAGEMARLLLRGTRRWNRSTIQTALSSGHTRAMKTTRPALVILTYQTAWAHEFF